MTSSALASIESDDVVAAIPRFHTYVERWGPDDCWPYTGAKDAGYGRFWLKRGMVSAHAFALRITGIYIPLGWHVHHRPTCDLACCNPAPLRLMSPQEHIREHTALGTRAAAQHRGRNAKLNWDAVREIRIRAEAGEIHRVIAGDYGVSRRLVDRVVRGEIWS